MSLFQDMVFLFNEFVLLRKKAEKNNALLITKE
jgi:hypothetical protein